MLRNDSVCAQPGSRLVSPSSTPQRTAVFTSMPSSATVSTGSSWMAMPLALANTVPVWSA
jgi:hypothetical protein